MLTIYLVWGSTYLAIRFAVETIPPFLMAGVRFLFGGALFYVWARMQGAAKIEKSHWPSAIIVGLLLVVGGNGLVSWAEQTVPSGITALLIGFVPMWFILFEWLRPKGVRPPRIVFAGLALGFAGVTLLINPTGIGGAREIDLIGSLVVVLATILWAGGSVYSRYAHAHPSQFMFAGMQMLAGGAALIVIGFLSGEFDRLDVAAISSESYWGLIYLSTIGSVAFAVFIWLMKASTPARVATYAYVNPVVALALGAFLAGEVVSSWTLGCSVVILVAVAMIVSAREQTQKDSEAKT